MLPRHHQLPPWPPLLTKSSPTSLIPISIPSWASHSMRPFSSCTSQLKRCLYPFQTRQWTTWPTPTHRLDRSLQHPLDYSLCRPCQPWYQRLHPPRRQLNLAHDATIYLFNQYDAADKALKQQIIGAINATYLKTLRSKYVGFQNRSTRDILDHLYSTYANISASQLLKNHPK
jgi:hypothetical protein